MEGGRKNREHGILMKSKFSKSWNSSVQPRKQVKFRANAPLHIKRKFLNSPLDKKLREKHGIRSIAARKGDEVKVMRGKFAKKQGKISKVDIKNTRVQIDGIQRTKKGGEKLETWFHPSKIKIITLDTSDKKRFKRSKIKPEEKIPKKPELNKDEIKEKK
jgi:large subunit ribosomal protein L24